MKINSLICIVLLGLLAACSEKKVSDTTQEQDTTLVSAKLFKEVMSVHDEVMPRMDELMNFKSKAKKKIETLDSLNKIKTKPEYATEKQQLDSLLTDLDAADNAMMDWMHQFDSKMEGKTESQKSEYLKDQQLKVKAMRDKMVYGLDKAKKILK
jgi:hypothetical protein